MLNSKGEVADFLDVSQFIPGKSAYECVAYSAALIYYCGEPGHGASGTTLQASNLAQYWYGKEEGSDLAANTNGMSLGAMHNMLLGMNLQYSEILETVDSIRQAITGKPVMLCGAEAGMYDLMLGDHVPYSWTPTGNHCIVVSGVTSAGNLLVHDCANVDGNGVRPGPRVYDASRLQIVSVTAVTPRWKGHIMSGVPQGWRLDGDILYSPSSIQGGPEVPITGPFRDYILANPWPPANVALEVGHHVDQLETSNPSLGSGFQQIFRWSMLGKPDNGSLAGKVVYEWLGTELQHLRGLYAQAQAELAQLKAQPAGLDAGKVADRLTALAQLGHQIENLATQPF